MAKNKKEDRKQKRAKKRYDKKDGEGKYDEVEDLYETSPSGRSTSSSTKKPKSMKAGPGQAVSPSGALASDVMSKLKRSTRKF